MRYAAIGAETTSPIKLQQPHPIINPAGTVISEASKFEIPNISYQFLSYIRTKKSLYSNRHELFAAGTLS